MMVDAYFRRIVSVTTMTRHSLIRQANGQTIIGMHDEMLSTTPTMMRRLATVPSRDVRISARGDSSRFLRVLIMQTHMVAYWPGRLRALAEMLKSKGASLTVLDVATTGSPYSFAEGDHRICQDLDWIRLFPRRDFRSLRIGQIARALWNAMERLKPDVVLAGAIAFPPGAAAVRWCRRRGRAVVIMDNARDIDVPRSRLVNWVKRRIYANVDAVLIPAPSHTPSYLAWGVPPERIFYGLNVVDNAWYARRAEEARRNLSVLQRQHGLPRPFFLGIGRHVPCKNWRSLLIAYGRYRKSCGEQAWDLVLVGDGPQRDRLVSQAASDLIPGVHFVPPCSAEELCHYYAMASCLILPSLSETWGNVVNEAMACGLPVLVSDRCGCAQTLVRDGENGWVFGAQDVDHLNDLLLRLSSCDESELRRMGQRSRELIADWTPRRFAEGAWSAIQAALRNRRGSGTIVDRIILSLWRGRFRPL